MIDLEFIINSLPIYIFWKDKTSVFQGCNKKFAELAGLSSPEDIVGKTDFDLPWARSEAEFFIECDQKIIKGEIPELKVTDFLQKYDEKNKWMETTKVPLKNNKDEIIGVLGFFRDVTDYKKLEADLDKANKKIEFLLKKEDSK